LDSSETVSRPADAAEAQTAGSGPSLTDRDYQDQADFRYALRRFVRYAEERAREEGLTPQQHQALLAIRGHPAYPKVTIGDVAERLQLRHVSASLLVDRCVRRGLLQRRQDPEDRRRVHTSLTDAGQEILDRLVHESRRQMHALEASLFRDTLRDALQAYDGAAGDETARAASTALPTMPE
jgi:DNA-binding MarR family transcriptional regulator